MGGSLQDRLGVCRIERDSPPGHIGSELGVGLRVRVRLRARRRVRARLRLQLQA